VERNDHCGIGVQEARDAKSPGSEPAVVGEGPTEVTDSDDGDGPVLGETKLT
jgi:hypothetical protein